MKIIINELGGSQWTGGITYRNNLLKAIKLLNKESEIVCLATDPENSGLDKDYRILKIDGRLNSIERLVSKFLKSVFKFDYVLYKTLKKENPDIIFPHSLHTGHGSKLIFWIPDFQFLHLPHLYPKNYTEFNRVKLTGYFERAKIIIVSSEDAYNDLKQFLPQFADKVRVMRFVAHLPEKLYDNNPSAVLDIYNLPHDFIFLPNQFWSHKNHIAVFEALKLLKEKGIKPFVVCTGNPVDVRNPSYLAHLMQKISEFGVRDQIAFLGLIPHDHVYSLMRQCKFVLNPSHFEGWSTSVEEAKSVGKRMVLSDLNVHKEQNPANSLFFKKESVEDLAEKLSFAWENFPTGPDIEMETVSRNSIHNRMSEFARTFFEICNEARLK